MKKHQKMTVRMALVLVSMVAVVLGAQTFLLVDVSQSSTPSEPAPEQQSQEQDNTQPSAVPAVVNEVAPQQTSVSAQSDAQPSPTATHTPTNTPTPTHTSTATPSPTITPSPTLTTVPLQRNLSEAENETLTTQAQAENDATNNTLDQSQEIDTEQNQDIPESTVQENEDNNNGNGRGDRPRGNRPPRRVSNG